MSSAALSLFVACENPRPLEQKKPKSIVFDAQIFIPGSEAVIAAFRYYNKEDFVFVPNSIFYVHANVSKLPMNICDDI